MDDEEVTRLARPQSTTAALIAGSFGGAAQVLVGQPLDTIKTRAQTAKPGMFKSATDIAIQTIKKEGIFALYKGMSSPLIGVALVNSLLFSSNQFARKLLSPYPKLNYYEIGLAGGIAGSIQSIAASPVEMFKIRMQANYNKIGGNNLINQVGEVYKEFGWRKGIMRGYWITVLKEIPAYAGFYVGYEFSKRSFQSHYGDENPLPIWATLTSGGFGGIAYWTACYPLDVVKSRIQLSNLPPVGVNYIFNTFRSIYQKEGFSAFTRGLGPSYVRAVPSAASTFIAFEYASEYLKNHTNL